MIVTTEAIQIKDYLGQPIRLGDKLQVYRPATTRTLRGTKAAETLTLPSVWYWGELQLNLEKGLVLFIEALYHPKGVKEGELEIAKLGWRISIKKAKFVVFKADVMVKEDILEATYAYATKIGKKSLKKHNLV